MGIVTTILTGMSGNGASFDLRARLEIVLASRTPASVMHDTSDVIDMFLEALVQLC